MEDASGAGFGKGQLPGPLLSVKAQEPRKAATPSVPEVLSAIHGTHGLLPLPTRRTNPADPTFTPPAAQAPRSRAPCDAVTPSRAHVRPRIEQVTRRRGLRVCPQALSAVCGASALTHLFEPPDVWLDLPSTVNDAQVLVYVCDGNLGVRSV